MGEGCLGAGQSSNKGGLEPASLLFYRWGGDDLKKMSDRVSTVRGKRKGGGGVSEGSFANREKPSGNGGLGII